MSKKIKINNINNKTKLIKRIERECNVKWPSTLDEHVLRGLWNKHNYDALYSIKPFNTFNSIESARLEGIIDRHFKAVQPLNASLSYAAPSKNSITSVSINNSNIPESTIKLDVYGEGINEQHSMDDVELKANNNNNIVSYQNDDNISCPPPPPPKDICWLIKCLVCYYCIAEQGCDICCCPPLNPPSNNNGCCAGACMDCCEDVCEHAICCNCGATIYYSWYNGNVGKNNNNQSGHLLSKRNNNNNRERMEQHRKFVHKRCCCCWIWILIIFILLGIGAVLFYFLYYKR